MWLRELDEIAHYFVVEKLDRLPGNALPFVFCGHALVGHGHGTCADEYRPALP